jgi:hypothetical protein
MSYQYPRPDPPRFPDGKHHQELAPWDAAPTRLESREPPLVTSVGVPILWNGHEWVPAPHLSPDGKAWWNGVSWVAVPSTRHRIWGIIAIVLATVTLAYCAPMSVIGIADSRIRSDYAPGLMEALYPVLLATPAIAFAVTSIVLDRREKRRPLLGWLSIALAGISALFLWFLIFAGT